MVVRKTLVVLCVAVMWLAGMSYSGYHLCTCINGEGYSSEDGMRSQQDVMTAHGETCHHLKCFACNDHIPLPFVSPRASLDGVWGEAYRMTVDRGRFSPARIVDIALALGSSESSYLPAECLQTVVLNL